MIGTVIVGYGLAGRAIHAPLVVRQPGLRLLGFVARRPESREEATAAWECPARLPRRGPG